MEMANLGAAEKQNVTSGVYSIQKKNKFQLKKKRKSKIQYLQYWTLSFRHARMFVRFCKKDAY